MRADELQYMLPHELVAQEPISERDSSRLMILNRQDGSIDHKRFRELMDYLAPGDLLVCNDTRVIPAKLSAKRIDTGGKAEILLLSKQSPDTWECLTKSRGRVKVGTRFAVNDVLQGEVLDLLDGGRRLIQFSASGPEIEKVIERVGVIPLPPYIHHELRDPERYQTVYAREKGSVASPTAGLHFTENTLADIRALGVQVEFVTLHISLDTFRPIQEEFIEQHRIFTEYCYVSQETADALTRAKSSQRRVIAVGTTTVRVLETAAIKDHAGVRFEPFYGWTDLFITPGYRFKAIDAMVTNFHLPRSTLLLLVGAFAGLDSLKRAYSTAIEHGYKFYSFGDAMLIL